jgi:hypothetical protein
MALGVLIGGKAPRSALRGSRPLVCLALALTSISCVPVTSADESALRLAAAAPASLLDQAAGPAPAAPLVSLPAPVSAPALAAPIGLSQVAATYAFNGRTPLDRLRSLDCLAQAIYYEAASESEDGQRAVAQVVLNRVRHPAWPNSVCGVVYQGPLRPGGGCQFTFTCDGSLVRRPGGIAWARARALAAEALAGRSYAEVGLSTHYHTHAVSPAWGPRLERTIAIGAHQFYRLPGVYGAPAAFAAAYSGSEPLPRPSMSLVRRPASTTGLAAFVPSSLSAPAPVLSVERPVEATVAPPSTIREEYRQSGQWRDDAPAAITGRR